MKASLTSSSARDFSRKWPKTIRNEVYQDSSSNGQSEVRHSRMF
jgi:hypothetical protein